MFAHWLHFTSIINSCVFSHSLIHPFIIACIRSFIHYSIHSCIIDSFIRPFIYHSFVHSFVRSSIHAFIHSFIHPFIYSPFARSFYRSRAFRLFDANRFGLIFEYFGTNFGCSTNLGYVRRVLKVIDLCSMMCEYLYMIVETMLL